MTEHLPIQRWTKVFTRYPASEVLPNESGEYVTYDDHLAALRACERQMLDAAREAVEEMDLHGCHPYRFPDCNCLGPQVIAAIDALRKEN